MKKILLFMLLMCFCVPAHAKSTVTLAELKGTVGVQMEEFVRDTVKLSELNGDSLLIFQLDTPGGLVEAMRGIVQAILGSKVPVAVWIPSGGRAASAGAFIVHVENLHGDGLDIFCLNLSYLNSGTEDFGCLRKSESAYACKYKGENKFFHIMFVIGYGLLMQR